MKIWVLIRENPEPKGTSSHVVPVCVHWDRKFLEERAKIDGTPKMRLHLVAAETLTEPWLPPRYGDDGS